MSRPDLRSSLSTPDGKRRYVGRLFSTIADRYDLITVLLSYGRDRAWKRRLADLAAVRTDDVAVDLACGTGDIAFEVARRGARQVVGLDITPRMIELAREKEHSLRRSAGGPREGGAPSAAAALGCQARSRRARASGGAAVAPSAPWRAWPKLAGLSDERRPGAPRALIDEGERVRVRGPHFLVGDMMALPFASNCVDLVTTGYGIRNVPVLEEALAEIHRVLRPGGRLLALDFNRPDRPLLRAVYLGYLTLVGSALGWILHRDPDTYRYIPESIRRYPGAGGVADLMRQVGFVEANVVPVLGGLMAITRGTK